MLNWHSCQICYPLEIKILLLLLLSKPPPLLLKNVFNGSQWSDLAEIRTRLRFYACPHYLQV